MPTNLPPEYFEAEKRLKDARTPQERVSALEELISKVPKHKGTDRLRADLRRKLSRLREEDTASRRRSGKGDLYAVEKQGAAQIALAGLVNAGKSALVQSLTNANPVVADYPVSTVMPLAGMMPFENIQFQLIDLPPLGNESTDGWVSGVLRNADALLIVVDLAEGACVQLDLLIAQLLDWKIDLRERGRERGEGKGIVVAANKTDVAGASGELEGLRRAYESRYRVIGTSVYQKRGLEELREEIFRTSGVVRVYTKQPGREPDKSSPFIMRVGASVIDLAEMIHKDFVESFRYACIWGSARFEGQRVQRDFVLQDGDVVEYHVR